jgi:hypothetical protein
MDLTKKRISPFWNAVIGSVIMVTSALLLAESSVINTVIVFEGVLFGIKIGDDLMKSYTIQKKEDVKEKKLGY